MRREVPRDIDVLLEEPKVQAARADISNFSDVSGINDLFDFPDGGRIQERVAGHEDLPFFCGEFDQFFTFSRGSGHGLFDKDMFTGEQTGFGHREVRFDGGRNDYTVQADAVQHVLEIIGPFHLRVQRAEVVEAIHIEVAHNLQAAIRQRTEVANEVRAPISASDNTNLYLLRHSFWFS